MKAYKLQLGDNIDAVHTIGSGHGGLEDRRSSKMPDSYKLVQLVKLDVPLATSAAGRNSPGAFVVAVVTSDKDSIAHLEASALEAVAGCCPSRESCSKSSASS